MRILLLAIFLTTAVFGSLHITPERRGGAAMPPRLFQNGEVAKVRATGRKVVVHSAEWNEAEHCYVYTVTPL